MFRILTTSWPLFFGLSLIMIANGLQGTLLGVRATIENFDTLAIGTVMSFYFIGYLGGSYFVPKLIGKVGHIRVFTALASLASATVLVHGLYPDPWLWALVRAMTGFSYAGLYIVVESWLNNMSANKSRGIIMGLYQLVNYAGLMVGQFLLNIADPADITLFVVTSILVSIALLPISLSSRPAPEFDKPERLPFKKLFNISPLGLFGVAISGLGTASIFGLGAAYAALIGMTLPQVSTFMAIFILGGVVSQFPAGWASDRFDRRKVIIFVSLFSTLMAGICFLTSQNSLFLNICIFFYGAISLSTYSLCMAHICDHLKPSQFVSASSTAIFANGLGAAFGPLLISLFMKLFGTAVFFPTLGSIYFMLFLFGIYRTFKRPPVPLEQQGDHMTLPIDPTPLSMLITEEGHAVIKELKEKE